MDGPVRTMDAHVKFFDFFSSHLNICNSESSIKEVEDEFDNSRQVVHHNVQFFSPASYNLAHFIYQHLPASEVRNAWNMWIRWFENVIAAISVFEGANKKTQLLAMGGLELQSAYYGLPGVDEETTKDIDPYLTAKDRLTQHLSPKHHDSFERFLFWSMTPESDEPIEKFTLRVQQRAKKLCSVKTVTESRHIAVIDRIIQYALNESSKMNGKRPEDQTISNINRVTRMNTSVAGRTKWIRLSSTRKL